MKLLPSTQDHLDFVDIRDDILILEGGLFRIVIEATAINFDLLSEDEQSATIFAYATLVNSLDYPVQVVIRTRQVDITDYINYLKRWLREQPTAALREQMEDYMEFVQQLVLENTVLQKRFFVVVPYFQSVTVQSTKDKAQAKNGGGGGRLGGLMPGGGEKIAPKRSYSEQTFTKAKRELNQRFEELKWQFKRLGIQIKKLSTVELIRLFYEVYNPEAGKNQGLKDDLFGYTTLTVKSTLEKGT